MTRKIFLKALVLLLLLGFVACAAAPAADAPTYTKGQKVQVEWKGKWYQATILEVGTGANLGRYKIHYDGWSNSWDEWVHPSRIKPAP